VSGWTDELAVALGVPAPSDTERTVLLDASREIAHRVERKETPLTTFLVGLAVGRDTATGISPEDALDTALTVLAGVLPAVDHEPPGGA
jgi:Domain of unknown function (DUF6457)